MAYVFVSYPVPSESFARVEINGLVNAGVDVIIASMRKQLKSSSTTCEHNHLENIAILDIDHLDYVFGFILSFKHFKTTIKLISSVLLGFVKSPYQTIIALLLIPSTYSLMRQIDQKRADVVHLFWGHYPSLLGMAARELKKPWKVTMSLGAYDLLREFEPSKRLCKDIPVVTHAEINVSNLEKEYGLRKEEVRVIYRGIEIGSEDNESKNEALRIIVAERLVKSKRTDLAIELFKNLVRESNDESLSLHIYGDGPERRKLECKVDQFDMARKYVTFHGHVDHDEIIQALKESKVCISFSENPSERLPNILKEAMANKALVVTVKSPGIDELVEHNVNGFVVDPRDIKKAEEHLFSVFRNKDKLERMVESAYSTVCEKFDLKKTSRARIDLFQSEVSSN